MSSPGTHTYHCICSELIFGTCRPLASLPKRKADEASICTITTAELLAPDAAVLSGSTFNDTSATILKLEDGFEKRYAARCKRCEVQIGYWLDNSHFDVEGRGRREDVLYLLSGGLVETDDMNRSVTMGH